jgi:hypothetical protein
MFFDEEVVFMLILGYSEECNVEDGFMRVDMDEEIGRERRKELVESLVGWEGVAV